jgi:hypothetical protein
MNDEVKMSTITEVDITDKEYFISQGDIFKDVKYIYNFLDYPEHVDITEIIFPYVIILNQACDMLGMYELRKNNASSTKQMSSVLVAPIFEKESVQSGSYITNLVKHTAKVNWSATYDINKLSVEKGFNGNEFKIIKSDFHYRYHLLTFPESFKDIPTSIIDFKQYFTVDINYLYENIDSRICSLRHIFKEQVTRKFSNFLSRVAIPEINKE